MGKSVFKIKAKRLKSELNLLDLFCGCGGISEGFRLAGFNICGGMDNNTDSVTTFSKNFPKSLALCEDISKIENRDIVSRFESLRIDLIAGGPPCQGFSNANRWQKSENDPRNKLFFDYLRFVKILRPKVFLIENVRGILTKNNGYAKTQIMHLVEKLGYMVSCEILNAADFGVPQNRFRAFFVAVRSDISKTPFDFNKINKLPAVTVADAIGELFEFEKQGDQTKLLVKKPSSPYRKYLRSYDNVVNNHPIVYPAMITQKRIACVPQGGNWTHIPKKLFDNNRTNRHSSAFKRLHENNVSVTIDTGNAHSNYFHPRYNRIPTVREAARLQSFRDGFIFTGNRSSQYKQVGNAVPPLLIKAIAQRIKQSFFIK